MTPKLPDEAQGVADAVNGIPPAKTWTREQLAEEKRLRRLAQQALDAFRHDLPQLMAEGEWKWVAYHGDRFIAGSQTKNDLYQECLRLGYAEDDFIIRVVEPEWAGGEYIVEPLPGDEEPSGSAGG